jgi:hypothetical protein
MKKFTLLLFAWVFVGATGIGQQNLVLNFLDDVPQRMYANPATLSRRGFSIGLPGLSGIYTRFENTVFNPYHMFERTSDGTAFRTENFLSQVRDYNYIGIDNSLDLFMLSFSTAPYTQWSITLRERMQARAILPGDLIRFPFIGNGSFDTHGNTLDFSGLGLSMNHYRELAVGWHHKSDDGLTIGIRGKLLFGSENIDTKVSEIQWTTDPDTYDWTFAGEMQVNTAGVWPLLDSIEGNHPLDNNQVMSYLFSTQNSGMGIDIGAEKKITQRFSVSGAVTDLGFINWKRGVRNIKSSKGEFAYIGLEFTDGMITSLSNVGDSLDQQLTDILAEAEDEFGYADNENNYRSATLARFQIGADYMLFGLDSLTSGSIGVLFQSEVYKGRLRPTYTIAYSQNVKRWLSATIAYSVIDRNFKNLGLGLRLNGGPLQLYVATDNLLAAVLNPLVFTDELGNEESRIPLPSYARTVQLQIGINLTF